MILTDAPGDQAVPTPSIDPGTTQYEDLNGDLRWIDNNQLVANQPNRSIYQDDDGTWRFADTHRSIDGELDTPPIDESGPSPIMGFDTVAQFMDFGDALHSEFAAAGIDDADFYMQGSAVTNRRFDDGTPFDSGKSDFDILVVSDQLTDRAREAGLEFRNNGVSRPIDRDSFSDLADITEARDALMNHAGRRVSFRVMLQADFEKLEGGPGVFIPSRQG